MATKITTGLIDSGAITSALIGDASITADDLHTSLDLTGKTVTVATATAGDNDTTVASTAFVSTAIANLADSAPSTLDTLNELAAALGDDANFSTTVTNSIATKLPLAGGTLTGALTLTADANPALEISRGSANTTNVNLKYNTTLTGQLSAANGQFQISAAGSSTPMEFFTNGSERMRIDSSGRVLVGITGASGFGQLETTTFTSEGQCILARTGGNVGIGDTSPIAKLTVKAASDTIRAESLATDAKNITMSYHDSNDQGQIFCGEDGVVDKNIVLRGHTLILQRNGGTEAMRIDSSGNVGIGTTNTDSFKAYVDASSGKGLFVQSGDGGYTALGFDSDSGNARMALTGHNGELWMGGENSSGTGSQGEFRLKPGSSAGNVLYLDGTTGNVGINWGGSTARLGIIQSGSSKPGMNITDGATSDFMVYAGHSSGIARIGPSTGQLAIQTGGSERMRIDSSGRITMPYQPAFCVYNPPGTYHSSTTDPFGKGTFSTYMNVGSHFSTTTGRFTAPVAGNYYFSFSAMFDSSGSAGFDFKINGVAKNGGEGLDDATNTYVQMAGSILFALSANDYVTLTIRGRRIHQRYGSFEGFLVG